eukprot:scaffold2621_cov31-Tisochrysis_lutea.AAC.12
MQGERLSAAPSRRVEGSETQYDVTGGIVRARVRARGRTSVWTTHASALWVRAIYLGRGKGKWGWSGRRSRVCTPSDHSTRSPSSPAEAKPPIFALREPGALRVAPPPHLTSARTGPA